MCSFNNPFFFLKAVENPWKYFSILKLEIADLQLKLFQQAFHNLGRGMNIVYYCCPKPLHQSKWAV